MILDCIGLNSNLSIYINKAGLYYSKQLLRGGAAAKQ